MKFGIVLLGLILLLLVTAVLPVPGGRSAEAVYYAPVFLLLLALLSASCLWCCVRRRVSLRQGGFYLVHLSVVLILSGAFLGYIAGKKGAMQLELAPSHPQRQVMASGGEWIDIGFDVAAENFQVQYYPPSYFLFRPLPPEETEPGAMPFKQDGEFRTDSSSEWKIGDMRFPVDRLQQNGAWIEHYRLEDGSVLMRGRSTPSYYGVTLLIDGEKLPIRINHPADHKGWRFYLMSYDRHAQRFVQLSVRRDPGRGMVILGIWMLIAGTFILCFRKAGSECQRANHKENL